MSAPRVETSTTKSRHEAYVDGWMKRLDVQTERLHQYFESDAGKKVLTRVKAISIIAMAIFFLVISPAVTLAFAGLGTVARVFSDASCENIGNSLEKIWKTIPFEVQSLGVILAMAYAPFVFPASVGIAAGVKIIGPTINAFDLARLCRRAERTISGEADEKGKAAGVPGSGGGSTSESPKI